MWRAHAIPYGLLSEIQPFLSPAAEGAVRTCFLSMDVIARIENPPWKHCKNIQPTKSLVSDAVKCRRGASTLLRAESINSSTQCLVLQNAISFVPQCVYYGMSHSQNKACRTVVCHHYQNVACKLQKTIMSWTQCTDPVECHRFCNAVCRIAECYRFCKAVCRTAECHNFLNAVYSTAEECHHFLNAVCKNKIFGVPSFLQRSS